MIKTSRQFFQSWERRPEESILPTQLRPVNFSVEDGQLLTQRELLCRERYSGDDQAPDEQKEGIAQNSGFRSRNSFTNDDFISKVMATGKKSEIDGINLT